MKKIRFTHQILVPNDKAKVEAANGYAEEMEDVKIFTLSQAEYYDLRKTGGMFDLFDKTFGTIIDSNFPHQKQGKRRITTAFAA